MLIFWNERLVLLAVPKTGTTAVEARLAPRASMVVRDPPTLKHTPVYRYDRLVAPWLAAAGAPAMETVAVVREPVSWLGSWYRYRHREDLAGHPNSTRGLSFDAFVEEYCRGRPAPLAEVGSQARFLKGPDGPIGVTHLFRYEAPGVLIRFLEERLGEKIDLPRLNVSPSVAADLSPDIARHLRRKRPDEFAIWEAGRT